jgi:hypothetical protein
LCGYILNHCEQRNHNFGREHRSALISTVFSQGRIDQLERTKLYVQGPGKDRWSVQSVGLIVVFGLLKIMCRVQEKADGPSIQSTVKRLKTCSSRRRGTSTTEHTKNTRHHSENDDPNNTNNKQSVSQKRITRAQARAIVRRAQLAGPMLRISRLHIQERKRQRSARPAKAPSSRDFWRPQSPSR